MTPKQKFIVIAFVFILIFGMMLMNSPLTNKNTLHEQSALSQQVKK